MPSEAKYEALQNASKRRGPSEAGHWILHGAALVLTILVGLGVDAYLDPDCFEGGCPPVSELARYRPAEAPVVMDGEGRLVGHLSTPRRMVVLHDSIPRILRDGFVAVEDRRFRGHGGVDVRGVLRAATENLSSMAVEEGASTITMQLVRTIYAGEVLKYNRWRRKLTEARLAWEIESLLSKDEILALYLNEIYLGGGAHGVEAAAHYYFGKGASALTLSEAALIIALTRAPERYDPRDHPELALSRRNLVLGILAREGVVTPAQAEYARARPLTLDDVPEGWRPRTYIMAAVRRELHEILPERSMREGVRVYTAYRPDIQAVAEESLREQIRRIEAGEEGRYTHPVPPETGPEADAVRSSPYLQGMALVLDASTGAVLALVGGRDFEHSEFDRAFLARRQPGSAFKTFIYAAALSAGIPPAVQIPTTPVTVRSVGSRDWVPRDAAAGAPLTLRDALVRSSNRAAVRTGEAVGLERIRRTAWSMGLRSEIPPYPSSFLGAAEVVPAELVAALAPLTNGGRRVEPHVIVRIEGPDGRTLWAHDPPLESALDAETRFLLRDILEDVVIRGTGWRVRRSYQGPAAGKTGTTNGSKDTWFVGVTPGLAAGVWLGFDRPRTITPHATGGAFAAPVWARIVAAAVDSTATWPGPPQGIVRAPVDVETGYRASQWCPGDQVREEYFHRGSAPTGTCPLHAPSSHWDAQAGEVTRRALLHLPDSGSARHGSVPRIRAFRPQVVRGVPAQLLDSIAVMPPDSTAPAGGR